MWSVQSVVLVLDMHVVVVLGSCIARARRECYKVVALSPQGVDLVFSVQVVFVFRLLHCLCKA